MTQSDIINNNFSKAFECIKCSNAYDTGAVLSEEKLFKQLSERKRSTFDLSKFEVVGSPTISDDGVASGFNGENYLTTGSFYSRELLNKSWKITIPYKVNDTTENCTILGFGECLYSDTSTSLNCQYNHIYFLFLLMHAHY